MTDLTETTAVMYTALAVMAGVWLVTWYVETFLDKDSGLIARAILITPPAIVAFSAGVVLLYHHILASIGGAP